MALIGQIRKNSWIIVVFIALGVGGFLLMDIMTSGNAPGGGGSQMVIGEVEGEKFDRAQFERTYSMLYQNSGGNPYANRGQLWNWFIENQLISAEADELGLGVSREEIRELEFGDNPSQIIVQRFSNPAQPGAVDREQLNNIKTIIDENRVQEAIEQGQIAPSFTDYWLHQRKEIVKERLQSKLAALVSKAMYTPNWMAEMAYAEQNQFYDFVYVKAGYDAVQNEEVSLTDEDIEKYLMANKARYTRKQEMRQLDYVVFNVTPTKADSMAIRDQIAGLANEFKTTDNDSNFVLRNEGTFSPSYVPKAELGSAADSILKMATGGVYGPYMDGGAYKVTKLIDRQTMADSADSRHILIQAQSPQDFVRAEKTIDSLMNLLNTGAASFDSLAMKFSQDPGSSSKGGKYENTTPGTFVPEYNEVLFVTGQIGQRYKIKTSFGYHIVEVLKRSASRTDRAKVAHIQRPIIPSEETQSAAYDLASSFIAKHNDLESLRQAVAKNKNLSIQTTEALDKNAFVLGDLGFSNDTRDMICWAFSADKGDVSGSVYTFTDETAYYDSKYVLIGLRSIQKAGLPSAEDARAEVELNVINEKKAEILKGRMAGKSSLNELASTFGAPIDSVNNASFSLPFVEGLGNEPKVVATAYTLEQGQLSAPIQGESGVFVLQVTRKAVMTPATNLQSTKQRVNAQMRGPVSTQLITTMREQADVEDNRATFDCGAQQ